MSLPSVLLLTLILCGLAGCGIPYMRSTSDEKVLVSSIYDAKISETEELVRGILKAPATAQFSNIKVLRNESKHQIIIVGAVDSQNSFSALLRATFENVYVMDSSTGVESHRGMFYDQNSDGLPTRF